MQPVENERGSVIVFVTLMIVILLVMVGLGLDTGQLTYVRNQGQAAVDAAALAAVSGLPEAQRTGNPAHVESRAASFNSSNDYVESSTNAIGPSNISYIEYDFTTDQITNYSGNMLTANGVRVALEQATGSGITTPVFLSPLLNLLGISSSSTKDVNVSAVSVITSKPALPIALWDSICPGGTDIDLQMQHPDPQDGVENSCWTTYLDCSSGAPDIKAGFQVASSCSGSSIAGEIDIGTLICQNKGQVNSVLQAAEKFFDAHPDRWWIVPVLGGAKNCSEKNPTAIVSWAKIYPKNVVTTGNPKYIKADVVCGDNIPQELETSLCFSHRLVREPGKGY